MAANEYYQMDDVANILNENDREKVNNWDGRIDPELTKNNVVLASPNCGSTTKEMLQYLNRRLDQLDPRDKKSPTVMTEWVVSLPVELKDASEADKMRFFEKSYEFIQKRYGVENVLPGFIHRDEPKAADHLQVPIIPIAQPGTRYKGTEYIRKENREDGQPKKKAVWRKYERETLSIHSVFTKREMTAFHRGLDAVMAKEFGRPGLVKNGRTKGGYTTEELKERTRAKEELNEWENDLKDWEDDLAAKEASLTAQEAQITARNEKAEEREERAEKALEMAYDVLEFAKKQYALTPKPEKMVEKWLKTEYKRKDGSTYTPGDMLVKWQRDQQEKLRKEQAKVREKYSVSHQADVAERDLRNKGENEREYDYS